MDTNQNHRLEFLASYIISWICFLASGLILILCIIGLVLVIELSFHPEMDKHRSAKCNMIDCNYHVTYCHGKHGTNACLSMVITIHLFASEFTNAAFISRELLPSELFLLESNQTECSSFIKNWKQFVPCYYIEEKLPDSLTLDHDITYIIGPIFGIVILSLGILGMIILTLSLCISWSSI